MDDGLDAATTLSVVSILKVCVILTMCASIKGMCTFINVSYIERTTWQGKRKRQRKLQRQRRSPRRRAPRRRNNRRELRVGISSVVANDADDQIGALSG